MIIYYYYNYYYYLCISVAVCSPVTIANKLKFHPLKYSDSLNRPKKWALLNCLPYFGSKLARSFDVIMLFFLNISKLSDKWRQNFTHQKKKKKRKKKKSLEIDLEGKEFILFTTHCDGRKIKINPPSSRLLVFLPQSTSCYGNSQRSTLLVSRRPCF